MILALKEKNCINLFKEVKPSTYKTFIAIKLYLAELTYSEGYRWQKFQDEGVHIASLRNSNKMKITVELLKEYEGACEHKLAKKVSYETKRQLKLLVAEKVLYPLKNDYFLINPKFLYVGDTWDTCYFDWCRTTGEEYNEHLAEGVRKRYCSTTHRNLTAASKGMEELARKLNMVYEKPSVPECELPAGFINKIDNLKKEKPVNYNEVVYEIYKDYLYEEWLKLPFNKQQAHPNFDEFFRLKCDL